MAASLLSTQDPGLELHRHTVALSSSIGLQSAGSRREAKELTHSFKKEAVLKLALTQTDGFKLLWLQDLQDILLEISSVDISVTYQPTMNDTETYSFSLSFGLAFVLICYNKML
ncbi:hypothetical protein CHARACLAT_004771 [Characodon lateralis]|uniref:Uncharacterized protein n=1 Tax=Characodon lateralis TaxID=208331 RepID=A0ABU7EI45_9TELE|nr:hypothetical protein [Characodon lateralis]